MRAALLKVILDWGYVHVPYVRVSIFLILAMGGGIVRLGGHGLVKL